MAILRQPTLSIITVAYRNPKGLGDTFTSLQRLTKRPDFKWEHVVVDSSPEEHRAILQSLPSNWPLLYLQQPPKGIYPAMNLGIAQATGRFLWFLNGGDALEGEGALLEAVNCMEADPDLSASVSTARLYRDGKFLYCHRGRTGLLPLLGINRVCHQAVIYRRDVFSDSLASYDEQFRLAADYDHHLRFHLLGKKMRALNLELVRYDMSGQSGDYRKIMGEFAVAQKLNRHLMPGLQLMLHVMARKLEHLRLGLFRILRLSPFGPSLRKIWIFCRRSLSGAEKAK